MKENTDANVVERVSPISLPTGVLIEKLQLESKHWPKFQEKLKNKSQNLSYRKNRESKIIKHQYCCLENIDGKTCKSPIKINPVKITDPPTNYQNR